MMVKINIEKKDIEMETVRAHLSCSARDGVGVHESRMSEWQQSAMPRAFLVKNKLRRPNTVDNSHMNSRHLDKFDSGERPSQPRNSESRCPTSEKISSATELTHRSHTDLMHTARNEGLTDDTKSDVSRENAATTSVQRDDKHSLRCTSVYGTSCYEYDLTATITSTRCPWNLPLKYPQLPQTRHWPDFYWPVIRPWSLCTSGPAVLGAPLPPTSPLTSLACPFCPHHQQRDYADRQTSVAAARHLTGLDVDSKSDPPRQPAIDQFHYELLLTRGQQRSAVNPRRISSSTLSSLPAIVDCDSAPQQTTSGLNGIAEVEKEAARRRAVPPRFECEACGKSYSTYNGLSKHREFHCVAARYRRQFVCPHCVAARPAGAPPLKTYSSTGALKMHIRTHTLPCRCRLCGKAFSRPWLLQGHLRTHTGEKPFRCADCHRAFADRSNLRAHAQTHARVKRYPCPRCRKTFSRMSMLQKHSDGPSGCGGLDSHHTAVLPDKQLHR